MTRQCILVFLKSPEKGKVKTRLASDIGDQKALELYKNFVSDILGMLEKTGYRIIICFYPSYAISEIKNWIGKDYTFQPQKGKNLGEKMSNAFTRAFEKKFNQVLLMGSDIPDLPGSIIKEAFVSLNDNDAVIGPAVDGGYYLIGFNKKAFLPQAFENIPWSTGIVMKKTLDILNMKKIKTHILPVWRDIDRYTDLMDFIESIREKEPDAPDTLAYLSLLGLL